MSKSYEATLVRGESYKLGSLPTFLKGKPQIVTAETKRKLEASAIDNLVSRGADYKEVTPRQKFKFKEVDVKAPVRGNKADELAAMQGDGDVDFDEDEDLDEDELEDDDVDAEDAEDVEDEDEVEDEKPVKKSAKKKGRSRK